MLVNVPGTIKSLGIFSYNKKTKTSQADTLLLCLRAEECPQGIQTGAAVWEDNENMVFKNRKLALCL